MKKDIIKQYFFYLIRWQLSTPILALCIFLLTKRLGPTITTVIANFIGGVLFFWVDRWIFKKTNILFKGELWEVKNNVMCAKCGRSISRGYRLIKTYAYDKTRDKSPEFRCHSCSREKYEEYRLSSNAKMQ